MRVLLPLPDDGFDTTEVVVPWRLLTDAGHEVVFATEAGGRAPACDPLLLTGVVFGKLGADAEARRLYADLLADAAYRAPVSWRDLDVLGYDGLVLPGGHAAGMRQYLGSASLHERVAAFWATGRPVGAICHGPVVLARTVDPATGRSVLAGRRTTALPKHLERSAFLATAWRRGRYYRTYPTYVQDEVVAAGAVFERGPLDLGGTRGTATDDRRTFTVTDGAYVSARWPGDAYAFARAYLEVLDRAASRP